jgi:hypothetical protein
MHAPIPQVTTLNLSISQVTYLLFQEVYLSISSLMSYLPLTSCSVSNY